MKIVATPNILNGYISNTWGWRVRNGVDGRFDEASVLEEAARPHAEAGLDTAAAVLVSVGTPAGTAIKHRSQFVPKIFGSFSCDVRPRDTSPDTTQIELAEEEEQKVSLNNTSATTGGEMGCWLGKIMWYPALFT